MRASCAPGCAPTRRTSTPARSRPSCATSTLTAREGTDHWRTEDMQARGNVVVVRDKDGGTMRTEVMDYNRARNEVSSDKSFVWDEPGRHVEGDGFTSDPEFKKITAQRPHGTGGQFILPSQ